MPRDRAFEREWLEQAARDPEFAPRVAQRLELGEREYGSGADPPDLPSAPLAQLLAEIAEEGLDVAGWGVLARQRLATSGLPPDRVDRIGQLLDEAALWGAMIDLAMRTAISHLPTNSDAPA